MEEKARIQPCARPRCRYLEKTPPPGMVSEKIFPSLLSEFSNMLFL